MSEPSSEPKLTPDQIRVLYEQQLNRTIVVHLIITLLGAALAAVLFIQMKGRSLGIAILLAVLAIVASGMAQRLTVMRVRCPSCGARVLGRIHSILQARHVTECPRCEAKLRR